MSEENGMSRRVMLVKLGIFLNAIVGAVLAVPIVRFLFSPVTREKKFGYESWLSLGGLEQFPAGQTRLATYRNPRTSRAGFGTSTVRLSRFLPSTARTLDARFAGFPSRASLCALVTEVLITRMDRAPQDLQNADCFSTTTKSKTERFL
jgi:hypothetical protein